MLFQFVIFLFVVVTIPTSVWTIKCYRCDSDYDNGCEPLDIEVHKPVDCPAQRHDRCYTRVTQNIIGEKTTVRDCFDSKRETPCESHYIYKKAPSKQIDFEKKKRLEVTWCKGCKKDGCNGISTATLNSVVSVFVVFTVLMQFLINLKRF